MPLTLEDIERIRSLGYKLEEFAEFRDGYWRLKNIDGHCVFLRNGRCSIYEHRPEGCRYYPVIEEDGGCTIDLEVCPFANMITKEEFLLACERIKEFNRRLDKQALTKEYRSIK